MFRWGGNRDRGGARGASNGAAQTTLPIPNIQLEPFRHKHVADCGQLATKRTFLAPTQAISDN